MFVVGLADMVFFGVSGAPLSGTDSDALIDGQRRSVSCVMHLCL